MKFMTIITRRAVSSEAMDRANLNLLMNFKTASEEILSWSISPSGETHYRLSEVAHTELLYEFAVKFEEDFSFEFLPVLDIRDLSSEEIPSWVVDPEINVSTDLDR